MARSKLFDPDYYLRKNPGMADAQMDPITHYERFGAAEGFDPNPLFNTEYYVSAHPELLRDDGNPLVHFITQGAKEGYQPSPLFNVRFYLTSNRDVKKAGINPLAHYLQYGSEAGRNPNPLWDNDYYERDNSGLSNGDTPALCHFAEQVGTQSRDSETALNSANRISRHARYTDWIEQYDTLSDLDRHEIRARIGSLANTPLFSIVFPLISEADQAAASETIESIQTQLYQKWELICVYDGISLAQIPAALKDFAKADNRVCLLPADGVHKSVELANHGIAAASGDYLFFIRSGDLVPQHGLYLFAEAVGSNYSADLAYGDEDGIDKKGQRHSPHFKCDWNPDLFLSQNIVGSGAVYRTTLVRDLGALRPHLAGAEYYDLALRIIERISQDRIVHIPRIVYRQKRELDLDKPEVTEFFPVPEEARRALDEQLRREGDAGQVEVVDHREGGSFLRIRYSLPQEPPRVTIIVPTRDMLPLLERCVRSVLEKTDYPAFDMLIVDNQSKDRKTKQYLSEVSANPHVRVSEYNKPFNFAAINNFAVAHCDTPLVCFLNNDTEVISNDWLSEMVGQALRPEIGAVGAKLYYGDGTIQHGGVLLGLGGVAGHFHRFLPRGHPGYAGRALQLQNLSAVTAACMVMRRAVFEEAGGFDEANLVVDFNDVDLCLKLREKGYRILWTPFAELYHHESATRGSPDSKAKKRLFKQAMQHMLEAWGARLGEDPFYSPNLALVEDFVQGFAFRGIKPWARQGTGSDSRDARLDPYGATNNFERAKRVLGQATRGKRLRAKTTFERGLAIVILTLDHIELIGPLLESLLEAKAQLAKENFPMDIIVGDTGSREPAVHAMYLRLGKQIFLQSDLRYHFARCNNHLFERLVGSDKVLFLNNDVIFDDAARSLRSMAEQLEKDASRGIVGTLLRYPDDRVQHDGVSFFHDGPLRGLCYHPRHRQRLESPCTGTVVSTRAVTGACLMIKSALFQRLDGFDEEYAEECQDVDLCLAARRLGFSTHLVYSGRVVHLENATRPKDSEEWLDRQRFVRKWGAFVEAFGL